MRKDLLVFGAAVSLGGLVVTLNLMLAPSLDLLSINSTGLVVLSTMVVATLALGGTPRAIRPGVESRRYRTRRPEADMHRLVKGPSGGYVSNRRSIARIVTGAMAAKLDRGRVPPSDQAVSEHLQGVLGRSYTAVVVASGTESRTRVPPSDGYLEALKEALTLLETELVA